MEHDWCNHRYEYKQFFLLLYGCSRQTMQLRVVVFLFPYDLNRIIDIVQRPREQQKKSLAHTET